MFEEKRVKLFAVIGVFLLGTVHLIGSISSIAASDEKTWMQIINMLASEISIPLYIIVALFIALLLSYLRHKPQVNNLTNTALESAEALNGFLHNLETKPIQESICGLYVGIRKVGNESGENKYFFQYLLISLLGSNEYQFITYDNFEGREYYVEGSCVRVADNLILKGAISGHRSAVQFSILAYPDHEKREDIKGLVAISRLDTTAALSTKVFFWKLNKFNNGLYNGNPKYCFDNLRLEGADRRLAKVYFESELVKNTDIKRMFGGKVNLDKAKAYVDAEYSLPGIIHS